MHLIGLAIFFVYGCVQRAIFFVYGCMQRLYLS
jgi:hypothetical protein